MIWKAFFAQKAQKELGDCKHALSLKGKFFQSHSLLSLVVWTSIRPQKIRAGDLLLVHHSCSCH